MRDFVTALGLVLVIEGLAIAAWPGLVRRAYELTMRLGAWRLRLAGLAAVAAGVGVVALARS